jgi:hypothetical protein
VPGVLRWSDERDLERRVGETLDSSLRKSLKSLSARSALVHASATEIGVALAQMVLCTFRRALLVFVAAACASSDTARPRAWGRPKKQPPPQVQQLTQLQLRQHAEREKAADTAEAEAGWAASDAEEEAAAAQRDLQA